MKMDIFSSGLFWGVILILIGGSLLLKVIFNINFPVLRVLFGVLLIYWGIRFITGISFKKDTSNTISFGEGKINYSKEQKEYNIIFGKAMIDLRDISGADTLNKAEINVIFGSADILVDETKPLTIQASSVFGVISFPDQTVINFGQRVYKPAGLSETITYPEVKVNAVFASTRIRKMP